MKQLTDWEVGQELIAISDYMSERSKDFQNSHREIWILIDEMRRYIGDRFNQMHTHPFGIYSHDEEPKLKESDNG